MSEGACTMRAMTEIEWLDGRVTKVPELALGDALGESVQAELDFGFDDVLEGLWIEVRHHEPDEDSDGDPRGRGCALYADCRYSLVEPSDLDRVFCILYEGQPRVQPRRGGAREPFAGLRVVLPHARISLPARRPRGPGRVRSIPLRSGFHVRPRRPCPRRGGIWDGGGFRNACGGENPVGRGLFVMLDIALQYGSTDHLRDGPTG